MSTSRTLVLIPARMAATRLPGKPLLDIAGLPMVVHVLRRAEAAEAQAERMRALAGEAIDSIEEWGAYAYDYFKEKWDLTGTVKGYRDRLSNPPTAGGKKE